MDCARCSRATKLADYVDDVAGEMATSDTGTNALIELRFVVLQENHVKATLLIISFVVFVIVIRIVGVLEMRIKPKSGRETIFTIWMSIDAMLRGLVGR